MDGGQYAIGYLMKKAHKRKKLRNILACDPLLKKGGVHGKTYKAERSATKQSLKKKVMQSGDSSPSFVMVLISLISIIY